MAYVTQIQTSVFSNIWGGISSFFAGVVSSSAEARLRQVEALSAKTDAELAAMNLRREDIAAYVFRDLMHI
jgi:hypothetical protein